MNYFPILSRLLLVFVFSTLASFSFHCGEGNGKEPNKQIETSDDLTTDPGILFFGDSLTAGLGLQDPETEAWPGLIGEKLEKDGFSYQIWNAGLSGDTTSGGLGRLDYTLRKKPVIFVLELGANDSMRGVPVSEIQKNLEEIVFRVREKYPDTKILLVGIKTFPNLGIKYRNEFDNLYPRIAKSLDLPLVPFLLEGIAGDRNLNQKDGIHPTREGHKIMAETVYPYLKKLI